MTMEQGSEISAAVDVGTAVVLPAFVLGQAGRQRRLTCWRVGADRLVPVPYVRRLRAPNSHEDRGCDTTAHKQLTRAPVTGILLYAVFPWPVQVRGGLSLLSIAVCCLCIVTGSTCAACKYGYPCPRESRSPLLLRLRTVAAFRTSGLGELPWSGLRTGCGGALGCGDIPSPQPRVAMCNNAKLPQAKLRGVQLDAPGWQSAFCGQT